jgi:hypothetical protein
MLSNSNVHLALSELDQQINNFQQFSIQQELPQIQNPLVETAFERVNQIFDSQRFAIQEMDREMSQKVSTLEFS